MDKCLEIGNCCLVVLHLQSAGFRGNFEGMLLTFGSLIRSWLRSVRNVVKQLSVRKHCISQGCDHGGDCHWLVMLEYAVGMLVTALQP